MQKYILTPPFLMALSCTFGAMLMNFRVLDSWNLMLVIFWVPSSIIMLFDLLFLKRNEVWLLRGPIAIVFGVSTFIFWGTLLNLFGESSPSSNWAIIPLLLSVFAYLVGFPIFPIGEPLDGQSKFQEMEFPKDLDEKSRLLAENFYLEAERMRQSARTSLWSVFGIVVATVLLVLFAGLITSIDLTGTSPIVGDRQAVQAAQDKYVASREREAELSGILNIMRQERESLVKSISVDGLTSEERKLALERLNTLNQSEIPLMKERAGILANDTFLNDAVTDAQSQLKAAVPKTAPAVTRGDGNAVISDQSDTLIATAVTRFGVVLVMMFFAQALINLYRYSLRISTFYKNKAFAVVWADGRLKDFERISSMLSIDHVAMGARAKTPLQEVKAVSDIAKSYVGK